MDPIRPITSPVEGIPPVAAAGRVDRVNRRRRESGQGDEHEPDREAARDDEPPPDDERPHVDVSA